MLHFYVFSSFFTISLIYFLYVLYGVQYFLTPKHSDKTQEGKRERMKTSHLVPAYMWDIYNNGVNSSEIEVIRGVLPTFTGASFSSYLYQNHRSKQLEFNIPTPKKNEILFKTEVKLISNSPKNQTAYFQIYLKSEKWIFLDEKKVSNVNMMWISFQVTFENKALKTGGSVTFLILSLCQNWGKNYCEVDFFHPVLLLSYVYENQNSLNRRRKRTLVSEDYEEETNRIWESEILLRDLSKTPARVRNSCRRKPLYVEFSDIDYDSWIVAPSGYEAFQCVGKCNFPISEHLSPTKHAILQTLVHNISPRKASRACCVPTKLDPISILYVDENGVLTYRFRYRDMVVAECGCR